MAWDMRYDRVCNDFGANVTGTGLKRGTLPVAR
jgi:hypothetical protein